MRPGLLLNFLLTYLLLLTLTSNSAHASEALPITGRVFTDHYLRTNSDHPQAITQSSLSTWLEFHTENEKKVNFHSVTSADITLKSPEKPNQNDFRLRARELYASISNSSVDLKVGQQIIPWGKSDGINPTDYLTAKDYTFLNPDDEVKRIGAPSVYLNITPRSGASPVNFTFVLQTRAPRSQLLIADASIPTGVTVQKKSANLPLISADGFQFAGKISYLASNLDFSLSYFRGYSPMPYFDWNGTAIVPVNAIETAVGTDFSISHDAYVFRLESALHMPDNGTDQNADFGTVQPWRIDSVLGAERPIGDNFRIQVQGLYRKHLYFKNPAEYVGATPQITAIKRATGRANALILNYLQQNQLGSTIRLAYEPESSKWGSDLFLIGYFGSGNDYFLRPQVNFRPAEGWRLVAGADLYGGVASRPLGSLKDFSSYFFEAKYVF
jgi:hypothetical protein